MVPSSRAMLLVSIALAAGCASAADVGQACKTTSDCIGGLSCIRHEGMTPDPVCMKDCTISTTRLCEGGAVCSATVAPGRPADRGVCYLGGTTAVGAPCTSNLECVRGAICIDVAGTQLCYRACTTTATGGCVVGEVCAPLSTGGTDGYCVAS